MHSPDEGIESKAEGIVILTSGLGQRCYAHRLYVLLARQLCRNGYKVLRFDFHGMGESEGEIDRALYIEMYNDIQYGMFVEDTSAAADFLKQESGVELVTVLGICGGAITALIALARFPEKLQAGILIGLPITLDKPDRPYREEITTAQARQTLKEYLPRLLSLRSWSRLLTFRSDIGVMIRSIIVALKSRLTGSAGASTEDWDRLATHPAFNPHVIPSFMACLERNQKLLLIFSEADRLRWEFESEFQEKCLKPDGTFYQHNQGVVIPEANHEFQFTTSKVLLQDAIKDWLSSGKQSG